MTGMDNNTFLVRQTVQDSESLVLSVKNGDKCYHFPIDHGVGKYEIQGTHMPFSSVNEMVDYYIQNGLPESQSGKLIWLVMPSNPMRLRTAPVHSSHVHLRDDNADFSIYYFDPHGLSGNVKLSANPVSGK